MKNYFFSVIFKNFRYHYTTSQDLEVFWQKRGSSINFNFGMQLLGSVRGKKRGWCCAWTHGCSDGWQGPGLAWGSHALLAHSWSGGRGWARARAQPWRVPPGCRAQLAEYWGQQDLSNRWTGEPGSALSLLNDLFSLENKRLPGNNACFGNSACHVYIFIWAPYLHYQPYWWLCLMVIIKCFTSMMSDLGLFLFIVNFVNTQVEDNFTLNINAKS